MELDDFKKRKKEIKADEEPIKTGSDNETSEMIAVFKSLEEKQRRLSVAFIVINCGFGAIYFSNLVHQSGITQLGYFTAGIGFFLGAIYLYLRYKPLTPSSYTLPLTEFLTLAERKIRYLNSGDYAILSVILLILGTGGGLIFTGLLNKYTDNIILLVSIWIAFFICLVLFGFWAGRKNWMKEYGSLYKSLVGMKDLISFADTNNDRAEE
jgi:hypothetical protein